MNESYEDALLMPKLGRDELVRQLRDLTEGDPEKNHQKADMLLLSYIDDEEITALFRALERWYA